MAAIAKVGTPSISSDNPPQSDLVGGANCGEAIGAGDILSLHSDGQLYRATPGTTRVGPAAKAADSGMEVTYTRGLRFNYGSGMTPGTLVYLSGSVPGGLDTVPQSGDVPIGHVCEDGNRIQFYEKMN